MKAFVAGGSGFVGQALVADLQHYGHQPYIYDRKMSERGSGTLGDIADLELLTATMQGADVVYHVASNPDISKAETDPTIDFREGTALTSNILEAMRINKVKRLVYFSGSGVYGEADTVFKEEHGPMLPVSTYGASKLASEAMICAYCHMFDMKAVALRPANIVGPGQTHGVGYDFLRRLMQDPTKLRILGDGTQTKSYVHISDVLSAVRIVQTNWYQPTFSVFNVGTEDSVSVSELAKIVVDVLGLTAVKFEYTGGDRGWKGDVPVIHFDCSKLRSLGWKRQYDSRTAFRASIEAMRHEITAYSARLN